MTLQHYIQYESKKFGAESLDIIDTADRIINEYAAAGYTLTLRQLYYQFVARGLIPNTEKSYKRLGSIITDGRLAGLLPWDGIEDRTRAVNPWLIQEEEREVLYGIEFQFALDYWARQGKYVEVWVEKEALGNVVERPCSRWRVPYMACKGYLSASESWRAGQRFSEAADRGMDCYLFHLGDHDPSGIDMTRDNHDRLDLFTNNSGVYVTRLALNMDQITQYAPPPNPTKVSDSRASGYISRFGHTSWELDALEPPVIDALVSDAIQRIVDPVEWENTRQEEDSRRSLLSQLHDRWDDVADFINGDGQ